MSTAATTSPTSARTARVSPAAWRWLLALVVLSALLFQLGGRGLNEPDEGRYAEIGREMAATNSYLVPRLDGLLHLSKPPLTYWLIALSVKTFGATDFAARLPAALAALGTVLAVFLLARSAGGEASGCWGALVLVSSGMFFLIARLITTDMILTCCITWSVWFLWRWHVSADRSWGKIAWFYGALGVGMLAKGPVAVVLPLFALIGLRWRNPQLALRPMRWGRGLLLFLAIAAPWFVVVAAVYPGLWHYFIVREVVERVATTVHGRVKPWWLFFPLLAGGFLPWTAYLAALVTLPDDGGRPRAMGRMCGAWCVLGLILFTLSRSKLPTYALPLVPPLAVLVALALGAVRDPAGGTRRELWLRRCGLVSLILYVAAIIGIILVAVHRYQVANLHLALLFGLLAVGAVVGAQCYLWRRPALLAGALGVTALAILLATAAIVPTFERQLAGKTPAKFLAARIAREDPGHQAKVIAYETFPRGLPFYLQHPVWWFHPRAKKEADVFEFNVVHGPAPLVLTEPEQVRALLAGSQRVFCVATPNRFATIRRELNLRLFWLEEAGDWVLFSNRPSGTGPGAYSLTPSGR